MRGLGEVWVRRPVLWLLGCYLTGLILSVYIRIEPLFLWMCMLAVIAIGLVSKGKALFPMLLAFTLLFGCFRGVLLYEGKNPLSSYIGQNIDIRGSVIGDPRLRWDKSVYILDVKEVIVHNQTFPVKAKVKLSHYPLNHYSQTSMVTSNQEEQNLRIAYNTGDLLQVSGTLKEPFGPRNPKGFDYKGYLARRGIHSTISATDSKVILIGKIPSFSVDRVLAGLRSKAANVIDRSVGGREGELLKAMLLGQRWLIEPETGDDFTRTGLAHILAISGLHIGYIVMMLGFFSSLLRLRGWPALIIQATILILYCVLVGAAPSVVRAVVMAVIYFTGRALGRKVDVINSAGLAALIILLIRPMDFKEVGFQLSIVAVCSIALFNEPIKDKLSFIPSKISALIASAFSAQLGTLPLTMYYFNVLSAISIAANMIVVPLAGLVVMGGFLLILVGMILPLAAGVLALPIKLLCTMILMVTEFAASLPFSYLRVISPSIVTIIVFYLVLLILSRERPGFVKKPLLACFMLVAVLLAGQLLFGLLEPRELKMVFLDVGQGDCCFIQTPDGKNILIDGGGKEGQNIGEDVVIPFLLKNGIWSLDLVIMSHCHDDHIGGLIPVLDQIKSEAFMEFPPGQENEAYLTLKEVITKKNIDVISVNRGQSFLIGDEVWLHILYPDEKNVKHLSNGNENNYSLVILLEYRDTSVLFTGDIEREAEYYLIGRISQTADILKIPHHGSNTSSTQAFLDKVSPETGIIQVGTNFFGHPSAQTLDRLDERGIKVFRNDNHGAVLLNYRNNKWTVRTMLEETNE